jgi:RimJ/RimL family protein N-acetyltransferase
MVRFSPLTRKAKNGIEITLRSPEVGEGAAIVQAVQRAITTSAHTLTTAEEFNYTPEQEDELISRYLADPTGIMIVPYADGVPVGMLNFQTGKKKRIAHKGEIAMSLLPEFRGQGIGFHMLEAIIEWARVTPRVEKLELRVHAKNVSAISLYQKLGFVVEGKEIKGVKLAHGQYDDVYQMALFVK